MVDSAQQVTTDTKQSQHDAMHREKPLRVRGGGEPPHLALTLPGRLVRHFRPITSYCCVLCLTEGMTVRCAAEACL